MNGMKGKNYSRLIAWYRYLNENAAAFVSALEEKQFLVTNTINALNVVKCGLYSKNEEVANLCCSALINIYMEVDQGIYKYNNHSKLKVDIWDWFISPLDAPANDQVSSPRASRGVTLNFLRIPKRPTDLHYLLNESGLRTLIRALIYHKENLADSFMRVIAAFGSHRMLEAVTHQLKIQFPYEQDYLSFLHDYYYMFTESHMFATVFIDSEALENIVNQCIQINSRNLNDNIPIYDIELRQIALTLLIEIWECTPELINDESYSPPYSDKILKILKRCCKDGRSKGIRTTSIMLMFHLLH